jgi:thiosulfate reductase cytochrome b subunit
MRPPSKSMLVYRHSRIVRLTHWVNVICITILLMSGLQIFNAHPALYFGESSDFDNPALAIGARRDTEGKAQGYLTVGRYQVPTTGVLGASTKRAGGISVRAFPAWATIPSYQDLATGRRWHFFFAWLFVINGLAYFIYGLLSGHFRSELIPRPRELRKIGASIVHHLQLRFPEGEEARHYNILQKLSYAIIVFIVLPLLILAGLTMSPALDSVFPWLLDLFGGRQTARTVHFIAATVLTLFVVVHVVMVLLSGVWNNLRSMVTGRYKIKFAERDANE